MDGLVIDRDRVEVEESVERSLELKTNLKEVITRERQSQQQKMKIKWAEEGGSRLFFKVINGRRRRNYIRVLEGDSEVVFSDIGSISSEISTF